MSSPAYFRLDPEVHLALLLDRQQPLHFIGVGGIGMSALAGILAKRGFQVSGSDRRCSPVIEGLRQCGVQIFLSQSAETITALQQAGTANPVVVISSAVPKSNPELLEARQRGWTVVHRSDVLAALISSQPSIAVAGSHGKTTTSTLIATLLAATQRDPTAVIGGIVPAFGSNARHGEGRLLVAEADESDGSLVKFKAHLGVITNLELDHTDHYPDLNALIETLKHFAAGSEQVLANKDCPILREHFEADHWWSTQSQEQTSFAAIAVEEHGDGTVAQFYENGQPVGLFELPLPGRHNLNNATAALAACRLEGVPFAELQQAIAQVRPPGRRFDCRGLWQERIVVDDYAHHPSEVSATLAMARLMVNSGRSPLPAPPQRLVAIFQPHRYSRTAQFLEEFSIALCSADLVVVAPLYAAGEDPILGISSQAMGAAVRRLAPQLEVLVADSLDQLTEQVVHRTRPGDLVLAMGAGDVNSLWDRLAAQGDPGAAPALVA